jgi:hypothetical protein
MRHATMGSVMTSERAYVVATLVLGVLGVLSRDVARAQEAPEVVVPAETSAATPPSDATLEEARSRFVQGLALARAGNCEGAVAEFRASIALAERPNTLFNLARCEEELFRYDLAVASYERYLAVAPADAPDRPSVEATMRSLRNLLGTIAISVNVPAEVWLGDRLVGEAPGEVLVPGGSHTLEVRRDGSLPVRRQVELAARQRVTIEVVLEQAQQTTVQNVQNVQNVTVEDRGLEPTVFWGGVGVTAGVAVVGFGLAGRAMALRNDADALDPLDAPGRREARDDVHRASVVADVLFGTAGALAVGTVVIGLMTDFGDEDASASTVVVMPVRMQDGFGLSATGRF